MAFFPGRSPDSLSRDRTRPTPLAYRPLTTPPKWSKARRCATTLRFRRLLLGTPCAAWAGDPFRSRLRPPAVGGRHRLGRDGDQARARDVRAARKSSARLTFCFHDPRHRAGSAGTSSARTNANPRPGGAGRQGGNAAHRSAAPVGDGETSSANPRLRAWRRHEPANADVFAYAAAQVKKCLEVTLDLGGRETTSSGAGREGYSNLYNTDLKRELDHLARFFHLAVEYKKERSASRAPSSSSPKPKEPTVHQYDFDVAAVIAFLAQTTACSTSSS